MAVALASVAAGCFWECGGRSGTSWSKFRIRAIGASVLVRRRVVRARWSSSDGRVGGRPAPMVGVFRSGPSSVCGGRLAPAMLSPARWPSLTCSTTIVRFWRPYPTRHWRAPWPVARWSFTSKSPRVLLTMMMVSVDVNSLLEGVVGVLLRPCLRSFRSSAWSCIMLCCAWLCFMLFFALVCPDIHWCCRSHSSWMDSLLLLSFGWMLCRWCVASVSPLKQMLYC
jgi:hypothetical protein